MQAAACTSDGNNGGPTCCGGLSRSCHSGINPVLGHMARRHHWWWRVALRQLLSPWKNRRYSRLITQTSMMSRLSLRAVPIAVTPRECWMMSSRQRPQTDPVPTEGTRPTTASGAKCAKLILGTGKGGLRRLAAANGKSSRSANDVDILLCVAVETVVVAWGIVRCVDRPVERHARGTGRRRLRRCAYRGVVACLYLRLVKAKWVYRLDPSTEPTAKRSGDAGERAFRSALAAAPTTRLRNPEALVW